MRKERIPDLQYLPHPQAELSELLTVFKIERAILMGDGTVEMFLPQSPTGIEGVSLPCSASCLF